MAKIGLKTLVAAFLFWYGLGYLNAGLTGASDLFDANFAIALFFATMLLGHGTGYATISKKVPRPVMIGDYIVGSRSFALLALTLMAGSALFFVSQGGGMMGYHAGRIQVALAILAFIYAIQFNGWKRAALLAFFLAVMIFSLGVYSRRPFLTLVAPIFLIPLIRSRFKIDRAPLIVLLFATLGVGAALYITGIRYLGETVSVLEFFKLIKAGSTVFLIGEGFDTISLLVYVTSTYDSSNYLNGQTFLGGLVNFVPRAVWPEKPIAFGIILSGQYYNISLDEIFTNFGPGVVAEAYANGGYIATAIVGGVMGFLVGMVDRIIENNRYNWNHVLFGVVFYPALFFMIRGDFLNSFYEFYSKMGIIWVVTLGFGLHYRLRPPSQSANAPMPMSNLVRKSVPGQDDRGR